MNSPWETSFSVSVRKLKKITINIAPDNEKNSDQHKVVVVLDGCYKMCLLLKRYKTCYSRGLTSRAMLEKAAELPSFSRL